MVIPPKNISCEKCRARKIKCSKSDGLLDCDSCMKKSFECTYSSWTRNSRRRKMSGEGLSSGIGTEITTPSSCQEWSQGITYPGSPAYSSIVVARAAPTEGNMPYEDRFSGTLDLHGYMQPDTQFQTGQGHDHATSLLGTLPDSTSYSSICPNSEVLSLLDYAWACDGDELYSPDACVDTVIPTPVLHAWFQSLPLDFSQPPASFHELQEVCCQICANTMQPFLEKGRVITQEDLLELTKGSKMRWEVVTVMLSAIGLAVLRTREDGALYERVVRDFGGRYQFAHKILEACTTCQLFMDGDRRDKNEIYICSTIALCALHRSLGHVDAAWAFAIETQSLINQTPSRPVNIHENQTTFHTQLWCTISISHLHQQTVVSMMDRHEPGSRNCRNLQRLTPECLRGDVDVEWFELHSTLSEVQQLIRAGYTAHFDWIECQLAAINKRFKNLMTIHPLFVNSSKGTETLLQDPRKLEFEFELLVASLHFRVQQSHATSVHVDSVVDASQEILKHILKIVPQIQRYPNDITYIMIKQGMLSAIIAAIVLRLESTSWQKRAELAKNLSNFERSSLLTVGVVNRCVEACSECMKEGEHRISQMVDLGKQAINNAYKGNGVLHDDISAYLFFPGCGEVGPKTLFNWLSKSWWKDEC